MTISVQPSQREHASNSSADSCIEKISENKFRRNPIPLFIVISVLVHGIGLVLFALIERSQPVAQLVPETAPIDFVIVPPEETVSTTPTDPSPQEETPAKSSIEPKAPIPETVEPISPSPTVVVPESVTESAPTETAPQEEILAENPPQPEPILESLPKEIKPPQEIKAETTLEPELPSQTIAPPEPILESLPKEIKPPREIKAETTPEPDAPSQTIAPPEPILESLPQETTLSKLPKLPKLPKEIKTDTLPQPETVTPSAPSKILTEEQNSAEILSGSDTSVSDTMVEETVTTTPKITKLEKLSTDIKEAENLLENSSITNPLPPKPIETEKPPSIVTESENEPIVTRVPPKITAPEPIETEEPPSIVTEPENEPIVTRVPPKITAPEPIETEETPSIVTETENDSVATRLAPKITSPQSLENKPPTVPNQNVPASPPSSSNQTPTTSSGAASLLGGNLKRSYEDDGGSSFFNLENNVSQQAYNPELNTQQRLDMRNYFSEIKRRVKRNWNPRYSTREHTTVLSFSIQRNGQITFLKVRRTSGSQKVDQQALDAVQKSGPFDPLPGNYPSEMLNVEFNFNIYIY
ncbi:MAG: TonB family protein [Xenococcus sp. (in: cyanobacteria)]